MLKRSLGLYPTPPIVECIDIVQPASVPIREMWQLGRDMIDRSEMDRDPVGQLRSMTRQACQQFLATLQVCWHCLARRENCFNSLLDLQDLWVKALLHIVLACKTPVTPGGVSTALPRSCLIFQSTVRTQENHDIFREKWSVTASLQRPRRCHGALMAFYRASLRCSWWRFSALSRCFLCASTALTSHAPRFRCHCADAVLKTQ